MPHWPSFVYATAGGALEKRTVQTENADSLAPRPRRPLQALTQTPKSKQQCGALAEVLRHELECVQVQPLLLFPWLTLCPHWWRPTAHTSSRTVNRQAYWYRTYDKTSHTFLAA